MIRAWELGQGFSYFPSTRFDTLLEGDEARGILKTLFFDKLLPSPLLAAYYNLQGDILCTYSCVYSKN